MVNNKSLSKPERFAARGAGKQLANARKRLAQELAEQQEDVKRIKTEDAEEQQENDLNKVIANIQSQKYSGEQLQALSMALAGANWAT